MSHELTLKHVTPRMTFKQKVALGGLLTIIAAVLISSYIWTGIDPFKLYEKRQNAFEYLFGRQLNEADEQAAMDQARRLPEIVAFEESYQTVKRQFIAAGKEVDPVAIQREARKIADARMAAMNPEDRETMVQTEYARIRKEKKGGKRGTSHRISFSQSLSSISGRI